MFTFNLFLFTLFYLSTCGQNSASSPTFTLIASNKLRPNSDYHVTASIHNVKAPVEAKIEISGPDHNSNFNSMSKHIQLGHEETQIINFEIGGWGPGNYKLSADVKGGLNFKNETPIGYESKSYSVFIQTDKAIYKPGQTVLFRAIIVKPSLNKAETGANNVYITDSKNNRIKQWNRVFTSHGVLSFNLKLSDNPVLGDWNIVVEIDNQTFKKSFTVAEYVLPTYDVEIKLPSYATFNKSQVIANIKATYTYGKPVTGEVTLTVHPRIRLYAVTFRPLEQFQIKAKLNGSVDIPVDIVRDLNLKTDNFDREIEFFALVEETLTGRTYNKTAILKVYDKDINIEMIKPASSYKPGLKYTFFLKVAYRDETPVEDNGSPVKVKYGYSYNEENYNNVIESIPHKGLVKVEIDTKNDNKTIIGLNAEYQGQIYYLPVIEAQQSESSNFIQLSLADNQNIKIGQDLVFHISCTEPITRYVYQVLSRGDIVLSKSISVSSSKNLQFPVKVTHSMTPKARVLVYYVRPENQEIVPDSISFEVDGIFRTPVTINTNVDKVKPGTKVDIQVSTKPNAYVALLGLDQSVLLLKSGNDITQKDVIKELELYDGAPKRWSHSSFYRKKRSLAGFGGGLTNSRIFDDAGLIIITNGLLTRSWYASFYRTNINDDLESRSGLPDAHLALPLAKSFKSSSKSTNKVKVRKYFPETWLWENKTSGNDGKAVFSSTVPDTITSWIISAFAMDQFTGLGIAENPGKITVFRQFFVKPNLPYSIIRGETVAIQVLVFNYFKKPKEASVSLYNDKREFNFTVASNEIDDQIDDKVKTKYVRIEAESAQSVSFLITTNKVGIINLKISANSDEAGDSVTKPLRVKPEGQPQYFNKAILLDFRSPNSKKTEKVPITIPNNAIPGSKMVSILAIGDVLGTSLNNLDDLLRMPYGCGEQNMLNFVPNIVVLKYLEKAKRLTLAVQAKAINHMEVGYQKELTYKRNDGSFSAFGNNDKAGSTWLTAFVLKSFQQARNHMTIDSKVIQGCEDFLISRMSSDGSFSENGEIHHKLMQGGSGSGSAALSAYVMIALSQVKETKQKYPSQFSKAEQYLLRQLKLSNTSYELSIITYALHLLDSPASDSAAEIFLNLMKKDEHFNWWSDDIESPSDLSNKQSSNFFLPRSNNVEATAYGLLTIVLRNDINTAMPIMKWLISKQNSNGGFSSTQDTVIALQALSELASRVSSSTILLDTTFTLGKLGEKRNFVIDSNNAQTLQRYNIDDVNGDKIPDFIEIEASGFGVAVVSVAWRYNLAVSAEEPAFYLNPLVGKASTNNFLQLNICTYYKKGNSTNMAVMEVELPSGYVADVDSLPSIKSQGKSIKRIESNNGYSNVVIYFDRMTRDELCLTVPAHRTIKVANYKAVPVTVYDYYNRLESARMMYQPRESRTCEICSGGDCKDCKNKFEEKEEESSHYKKESSGSTVSSSNQLLIIGALFYYFVKYFWTLF